MQQPTPGRSLCDTFVEVRNRLVQLEASSGCRGCRPRGCLGLGFGLLGRGDLGFRAYQGTVDKRGTAKHKVISMSRSKKMWKEQQEQHVAVRTTTRLCISQPKPTKPKTLNPKNPQTLNLSQNYRKP